MRYMVQWTFRNKHRAFVPDMVPVLNFDDACDLARLLARDKPGRVLHVIDGACNARGRVNATVFQVKADRAGRLHEMNVVGNGG